MKITKIISSLLLLVFLTLTCSGCLEGIRTPPWDEEEITGMQDDNIKALPLIRMKY
jgi:hypothetical protein